MDAMDDEVLFVGTAEAEHTEMYLKQFGILERKVMMSRLVQLLKD